LHESTHEVKLCKGVQFIVGIMPPLNLAQHTVGECIVSFLGS
jgi:hypothetical protein